MSPGKIAAAWGDRSQRTVDFIARVLRQTLDELAVILGFTTRPRQVALPIVAWASAAVVEAAGEVASA
jgi:hypothetical protein